MRVGTPRTTSLRASSSRKRSTASLGPKSSSSYNWRSSISASAPSPTGLGKRLVHSSGSSRDFTWMIVQPAMSSFASVNGPPPAAGGPRSQITVCPALVRRALVWILLGSSIGAPRQPNPIHTSDEALEQWIVAAIRKQGIIVDQNSSTQFSSSQGAFSNPKRERTVRNRRVRRRGLP